MLAIPSTTINTGKRAMPIALRLNCIKPSATLAMSAKAKEMKAAGRRVLDLSVGEPDFPTPSHIKEAAKAALDADFTRYTAVPGIPELRAAIAGYFRRFRNVTAPPEATMATNGGKQALYNLLMASLNPGDEVLIPAPYWVSYPDMVRLAGAEPVFVPTSITNGFKITVEALERARPPRPPCSSSIRRPTPRAATTPRPNWTPSPSGPCPGTSSSYPTRSTTSWSTSRPNPPPWPGGGRGNQRWWASSTAWPKASP
jgi:hypothetical protein